MHFDFNQILPNLPASYIFPPLQVLEPLTSTLLAFLQFPEDRMVLWVCTKWPLLWNIHQYEIPSRLSSCSFEFEPIKLFRKKEFHLLLDLNLVEPIHNLDVHLLLLDPLVHLGWQGNMPCGTYLPVYLHSLHLSLLYFIITKPSILILSWPLCFRPFINPTSIVFGSFYNTLLWQLYSQSSVDHIQTSSSAHLGSLQLKGKLRLGPCRLHLLVVGRLLQLEVPLNRFDVHNKRNYPGFIYSVSQKKLQTELGAQKS